MEVTEGLKGIKKSINGLEISMVFLTTAGKMLFHLLVGVYLT